ncbi:MAG: hypothetical protein QM765_02070 [Myxococcales bacterium]
MVGQDEDAVFETPFPKADELRKYLGKWIGFDEAGAVRVFGDSVREADERARSAGLPELTFFRVPDGALVG